MEEFWACRKQVRGEKEEIKKKEKKEKEEKVNFIFDDDEEEMDDQNIPKSKDEDHTESDLKDIIFDSEGRERE